MSAGLRVLDLFSGAGGAGMGYHRAGFEVVGVDINPQPRYPFAFIQHDALALDMRFIRSFDAIHASPPCQAHSAMKHAHNARAHVDLIPQTRAILMASGLPYVIENVEGAPLIEPARLCGTMFGLGAESCELRRHRIFETSFFIPPVECCHSNRPVIGVYGGHARKRSSKHGGRKTKDTWEGGHKSAAAKALGIDWMTLAEMSEAIPPAYAAYLGRQLITHLESQRAAA